MKTLTIAEAAALLQPGTTAFIHGTATEPRVFTDYLATHPKVLDKTHLLSSFVPGINMINLAQTQPTLTQTNTMAQLQYADAHADGRVHYLRHAYSRLPEFFNAVDRVDIAFLQVGQMPAGDIVTGVSGELLPLLAGLAEQVVAIVNRDMPLPVDGCILPAEQLDYRVDVAAPLVPYEFSNRVDAGTEAIAKHVAKLVSDGDTIQAGIGVIPGTVFRLLQERRMLRIFSGMISDATVDLAEAGALDGDFLHTYGMAMGSSRLYQWLHQRDGFAVRRVEEAHCRKTVAAFDHFVAMNSALEVALDGSVNAEQIGSRIVSGRGGLPDFAHGARAAPNGRSVIALPAANLKRGFSRIVPKLANHGAPTLPAGTATHIVTEFGTADIKDVSPLETAERLIAIADPSFRESLRAHLGTIG